MGGWDGGGVEGGRDYSKKNNNPRTIINCDLGYKLSIESNSYKQKIPCHVACNTHTRKNIDRYGQRKI